MSDQNIIEEMLVSQDLNEKQKKIVLTLYSLLDEEKKVDFLNYLRNS